MPSPSLTPVLTALAGRAPACGATRVVAVDGRSGAGKTELAARIARELEADVVHLEDLYPGWHGLAATPPVVADELLAPLTTGRPGRTRTWDWRADAPGPWIEQAPTGTLVLEGVGSGARVLRPYLSLLVWVEAPTAVRRRRALDRDGDTYAPFWDAWAAQEDTHFTAERTRDAADVEVRTG